MKLHTYLNYGGNCEEAFRFYEKQLGGKILTMLRHEQVPAQGPAAVPDNWKSKILYSRMTLGETDIMANDVPADRFQPMRSVYLSLTVDSIAEAERIHHLLAAGGQIFMPLQETFFAFRFSMLRDKFGTSWMIIHDRPAPPKL